MGKATSRYRINGNGYSQFVGGHWVNANTNTPADRERSSIKVNQARRARRLAIIDAHTPEMTA